MLKLSKASKMPCRSWSLQALDTCPASRDADGNLVPACSGCYATTGNYRFKNVRAPREHNRQDWKRDTWSDDMVAELDNDRYFRWFDSGDMYDIRLAHKILDVCERTPWVKNWIPTTSTIATLDTVPEGAVVCEAYTRAGKCDKCRACWDKSVSVVCYIGHGRTMEKQQRNIIARV